MILNRMQRWIALALILALLLGGFPARTAFARGGGVYWGYQSPTQWSPIWNYWRFASPWGALVGAGIPHHSLDPPQFNMGQPSTMGQGGMGPQGPGGPPFGWSWQTQPIDRSVRFPGSSSNASGPSIPIGIGGSTGVTRPVPEGPFSTNRKFEPPYYHNYNGYWLNGYWGGGRWGWSRWGGPLGTRSFPRWSIGSEYYGSGYGQYSNPFLAGAKGLSGSELYAEPVLAPPDQPSPGDDELGPGGEPVPYSADPDLAASRAYLLKSPEVTAGLRAFDAARAAFRNKDYAAAQIQIEAAIKQLPGDPAIHEFRALVLFARADYAAAAAVIYGVLAVSPGWNWTTLSNHYAEQAEFTRMLRDLEAYRRQHAEDPVPAFLSAYHYVTCRHYDAAIKQLETVRRLVPDARLVPPLITLLAGADDKNQVASTDPAASVQAANPSGAGPQEPESKLDKDKVTGAWRAAPSKGTTVELSLTEDDSFVWTVNRGGKSRKFDGKYTLSGSRIWLDAGHGGMTARLTLAQPDGPLHFKLIDNDPSDPGLQFHR